MTFEELKQQWWDDSDFIKCHTSGSTGKPSLISLTKEEMRESALRTNEYFNISSESLLHSCISPEFIGGKMMLIRSIVANCKFSCEIPSNCPLSKLKEERISLLSLVPSQMIHILQHPEIYQKIDNFLIGGASIPAGIREEIIRLKLPAYESYGMTETASHIALRKIAKDSNWFHTLGNITVFLHSENQLGINIGNKKVLTNDIAIIKTEREFRVMGRADNIINSGGKKISPETVEDKLSSVLKFPFYISSASDKKWGERVVLITTEKKYSSSIILEQCKEVLLSHEVPKEVIFVTAFPLTENGKIRRFAPFIELIRTK